jgi:predicted esterase
MTDLNATADSDVVAYRDPDRPAVLLCRGHGGGYWELIPVTSDDLPDGGFCTWVDCGTDVLIAPASA